MSDATWMLQGVADDQDVAAVAEQVPAPSIKRARTEGPMSRLAAALVAFQRELPQIKKSQTAEVETKAGRKYRYTYAGLPEVSSTVLPLLAKHGLCFVAKPMLTSDGKFVLSYRLQHESGEYDAGEYPLPSSGSAQELGSAISYARRYTLCSVVGVAAEEDDDGRAAPHTDTRRPQWNRVRSAEDPGDEESPVTQAQHRRMGALFREVGATTREERLAMAAGILGMKELATSASLTAEQAGRLIAALEQKKAERAEAME